jgi:hypothetical protein
MIRRNREFWYSLAAIAAVTGLYVLAYRQAGTFPVASSLVGHGIGVVGIVLMLMTATLYSLRKLSHSARWGDMAGWLRFHMVTGLVGPYMVLLHTSMRFHGVAGVAMLFTIVVVISGLVGRYLYTAVPRGALSVAAASAIDRRIARSELTPTAAETAGGAGTDLEAPGDAAAALEARRGGVAVAEAPPATRDRSVGKRAAPEAAATGPRLDPQAPARGALASWHAVHVPLVLALFVVALVHMVGALYYALG